MNLDIFRYIYESLVCVLTHLPKTTERPPPYLGTFFDQKWSLPFQPLIPSLPGKTASLLRASCDVRDKWEICTFQEFLFPFANIECRPIEDLYPPPPHTISVTPTSSNHQNLGGGGGGGGRRGFTLKNISLYHSYML